MSESNNNAHTSWLEKLQQESWNLELLISGFSIFLLIQATAALSDFLDYFDLFFQFSNDIRNIITIFWGIALLSCYVLIINLIFHIILRGFWIGAIGLRSVQPKVDFQRLRYAPVFDTHLKVKLPPLDRLLIRLDQVSSAVFSFTFLIVFMLLSLAIWFFILSIFVVGIESLFAPFSEENWIGKIFLAINFIIILLFVLISFLYLIDTLSMGLIKKIKWFSKPYRWIYRLLSTITLSFLYRSIYYHLISYFGLWRSRLLLNGVIFAMLLSPYVRLTHSIFYPDYAPRNEIQSYYYDDMRTEGDVIWGAAIPSSIITADKLPVFIRYAPSRNITLMHLCSDYTPTKKQGFIFGVSIDGGSLNINDPYLVEASSDSLLNCLSSIYEVRLNDSLYTDLQYYYLTHPNRGEQGIYTVLDIKNLTRGHHRLDIKYKDYSIKQDTVRLRNWVIIPFWKE